MARRFKPNANFQMVVSEAVAGAPVVARARGNRRRNQTTLQDIADEIVEHAKEIVDSEVGLPSIVTGGGRDISYDFRSEDRRGRTYRASFGSGVRTENGRLVVIVFNDHEHAYDVEYGNGPGGQIVEVRRKGGRYWKLPITMRSYIRRRKFRAPLTEAQKQRKKDFADLAYWRQRTKQLTVQRKTQRRRVKTFVERKGTYRGKPVTNRFAQELLERSEFLENERAYAKRRREVARARVAKGRPKRGSKPESFPMIGDDGQPYLMTRTFRTYKGYGILQRAIRNIARHRF